MTSVILASADEQLLAVLMGLSHAAALEQSSSAVLTPAALSLRKYHYPRCLSSRIHREQSDGRARTLDTIRRLELVTQSLACEGNSGNVSAEGVFGCQRTGHRCFLCRSYDQVQMKTQDPCIIPHPESLVKRFQEIFLYFSSRYYTDCLTRMSCSSPVIAGGRVDGGGIRLRRRPLHVRSQRRCARSPVGRSRFARPHEPAKSPGRVSQAGSWSSF